MSTRPGRRPWLRPSKLEPTRRRERNARPIPREDVFKWRPEVEVVVGEPRPARKAKGMAMRDLLRRWLGRRAQPAPLDAGPPFPESAEVETPLAEVVKAAFDSGVQAERTRMGEILTVPGVASYPLLAVRRSCHRRRHRRSSERRPRARGSQRDGAPASDSRR
jgi:hypothetical protein